MFLQRTIRRTMFHQLQTARLSTSNKPHVKFFSNNQAVLYSAAFLAFGATVSMAAIPLYTLFCTATGYGGAPVSAISVNQ